MSVGGLGAWRFVFSPRRRNRFRIEIYSFVNVLCDASKQKNSAPRTPSWPRAALANTPRITRAEIPNNVHGGMTTTVAQLIEYRTYCSKVAVPTGCGPTGGKLCFSSTLIPLQVYPNYYTTVEKLQVLSLFLGFIRLSNNKSTSP